MDAKYSINKMKGNRQEGKKNQNLEVRKKGYYSTFQYPDETIHNKPTKGLWGSLGKCIFV